jgi:hypothetical protein
MTSEIINKINQKSKQVKFEASRNFKSNTNTCVPYEEEIGMSPLFPEFIYLVHKNMIFDKRALCDSSYNVYRFDKSGNFLNQEEVKDLGLEFFRTFKVLKKL